MKGIDDYKFGQKNTWRRMVWKELSNRTKNKREALILYLAGEQDLDRKLAIQHGFHPNNMIIVEIDRDKAKALRKQSKTVINAEILDVLNAWPLEGPEVSIVYADFCGGLAPTTSELHDMMWEKPSFANGVAVVNLMRGRDPSSNKMRELTTKLKPRFDGVAKIYCQVISNGKQEIDDKHRGYAFILGNSLEIFSITKNGVRNVYGGEYIDPTGEKGILLEIPNKEKDILFLLHVMQGHFPKFFTYSSTRNGAVLKFDSVIFNGAYRAMELLEKTFSKPFISLAKEQARKRKWPITRVDELKNAKKQITQAIAITTMRKQGYLSTSAVN